MNPLRIQLQPDGPGLPFRDRLAAAVSSLRGDVTVTIIAVVADLQPRADGRPEAVILRKALKLLRRGHGLRASWNTLPTRPRKPARKNRRKAGQQT